MLKVWNTPLACSKIDIDLLGKVDNSIENLKKIVSDCCLIEVKDAISFKKLFKK